MVVFRWLVLICVLVGCTSKRLPEQSGNLMKYASTVRMWESGSITYLAIKSKPGSANTILYLLVPEQVTPPKTESGIIIRTPVKSFVCTSTTHIPLLDYLQASHLLIGFPNPDYISSEKVRQLIDSGKVKDVGLESGMNPELIYSLKPDLLMAYSVDDPIMKKLQAAGIRILVNADYNEQHPLGRAEWIKVMAALLDKKSAGDSIFKSIETGYNEVHQLIDSHKKPIVMSGNVFGNAWYLPGGKSYMARLFADAGLEYIAASDSTTGSLMLNPELVFEKSQKATLWIGCGPSNTLGQLKATDARYATFPPFQTRRVYNYTGRLGRTGGVEFFESGNLRPDIILKDLAAIGHPEFFPTYKLYYYTNLTY